MHENSMFNRETFGRFGPDLLAVSVLAAVLGFFYWNFLTGRGFIWNDTLTEFYPGVNYFAKSIHAGHFPLWFLGVRDGLPFYSDPQVTVFYPLQWLLIPFVKAGRLPFLVYQRYIVLHYLLGATFMYAFLRQIKLIRVAAITGALIFSLAAFASLEIVNFVIIQVYIWLPLQLLCVHRVTFERSKLTWFGLAGSMVLSLLAGHQQMTVYCWYFVLAYWLYCICSVYRKENCSWTMVLRRLASCELPKMAAVFVLVFALAAIMVIPAYDNWRRTSRPGWSFLEIADTSLPYHELVTLFVPNFFGMTQSIDSPVPFWGEDPRSATVIRNGAVNANPGFWQYWEFGGYTGQIFWIGLLLVLFNWRKIENKSMLRFVVVGWLVAVWFMLGRYGGLFQVLYYTLPGVSLFRAPAKMASAATVSSAILIACVVDSLWRSPKNLRSREVYFPAAVIACFALLLFFGGKHLTPKLAQATRLSWSEQQTIYAVFTSLACAAVVVGLLRSQQPKLRTFWLCAIPAVCLFDFYHAYAFFQRGHTSPDEYFPKSNRLLSMLEEYREQRGPFRFGQIIRGQLGEEIATFRNLPYFHDFLEVPEGYTSFYLDSIARFQAITNEEAKIAIQNIRVTMERDAEGRDWLGTRTNSFPRAKFFSRVRRYDSPDALRHALEQGEVDWRHELAVCNTPEFKFEGPSLEGNTPITNDTVQFESISPEEYSVTYNVTQPGIAFVSETFYPGWKTDNDRLKLIEVFGAFQGIVVPAAGSGRVVVRFFPKVLKIGTTISLLSLVIGILAFVALRRSSPRQNGVTDGI
jgi:hypothetical protein